MPVELIDALIRQGATRPDRGEQQRRQRRHRARRAAGKPARCARSSARSRGRATRGSSTTSTARAGSSSRWCRRATSPSGCAPPAPGSAPSSARPASARRWPRARRQRDHRRPRLRAGVPDHAATYALIKAHTRRPDGQPRLPQDRPQLRAGDGHRGDHDDRPGAPTSSTTGELDPEVVVTPSIYVDRVVLTA